MYKKIMLLFPQNKKDFQNYITCTCIHPVILATKLLRNLKKKKKKNLSKWVEQVNFVYIGLVYFYRNE